MTKTIEELVQEAIEEGLVLEETHFPELGLPDTDSFHPGKVRDNYWLQDENKGVMITTDRISAGDVVMANAVPLKGFLLAEQMDTMFRLTQDIHPNHILHREHPAAFVVQRAEVYPVEVIVRGYLTGSGWRDYRDGKFREYYGFDITPLMVGGGEVKKDCKFTQPIVTPTTKKEKEDRPLTEGEAIELVGNEDQWILMKERALQAYTKAQRFFEERGIILPDTKFEMGDVGFVDEIFTSDSSRFWDASQYQERFERGEEQVMMDKEIVRSWLQNTGLWKVPGVRLPVDVQVKTIEGYANVLSRMNGQPPDGVAVELQKYFERIAGNGGPERDIYDTLLESGYIKGYFISLLLGSGSEGKGSDLELAEKVESVLEELKLPYGISIASAHKDNARFVRTVEWIDQYPGDVVFIDITGMSNAKGPATAGLTTRNVVTCYDNKRDKDTLDLASSVNVPRGVPLAVVNGAVNSALYAAQIIGYTHSDVRERVAAYRTRFAEQGRADNREFGKVFRP